MSTSAIGGFDDSHVRRVAAIASKLIREFSIPERFREDLTQYGYLGLEQARQRFDEDRGVAFMTFAYYRIRGAMLDGLREQAWFPPGQRQRVIAESAVNDLRDYEVGSLDETASLEAMVEHFRDELRRLGTVYLATDVMAAGGDEDGATGWQPPGRPSADAPASEAQRELLERVRSACDALSGEKRDLFHMLYVEGKSMSEVGAILGKNKSTISRWHRDAVEEIRRVLEARSPTPP